MDATQKTALVIGIGLLVLAFIRLIYAFFVVKKLTKIEKCVDNGYGVPVSQMQEITPEQQFISEMPQVTEIKEIKQEYKPVPMPTQAQQSNTNNSYNSGVTSNPIFINQPKPFKPTPKFNTPEELRAFRMNQVEKMRAARAAKRLQNNQPIQPNNQNKQQPHIETEEEAILRRLDEIRRQK